MSRATVLAEAIKDGLNDAEFDPSFTAVRSYRPLWELKDLKTLRVMVIVPTIIQETISRIGNLDTISVDIAIMKQVDPSDNDAVDILMGLVEDVAEYFRSTNFDNALWEKTLITIPYDISDLVESRVFYSVIRVQYRICWTK